MSLAVAASRAEGQSTLTYPHAYRISYPRFLEAMRSIGVPMSISDAPSNGRRSERQARTGKCSSRIAPRGSRSTSFCENTQHEMPRELAVVETRDGSDATLTWHELLDRVERTATLLLALGVRPGECVAYQLPNCLEFVDRFARDAARRRDLLSADADLPRARGGVLPASLRRARPRRARRSTRPPSRRRNLSLLREASIFGRAPAAAARTRDRLGERAQGASAARRPTTRTRSSGCVFKSRSMRSRSTRQRSMRAAATQRRSCSCSSRPEPRASRKACSTATTS